MRPILNCCTPHTAYTPSGSAWVHADRCPVDPGQKVGRKVRRADVDALEAHPATPDSLTGAALRAWFAHPTGCLCVHCAYIDYWADRDDDEWEDAL